MSFDGIIFLLILTLIAYFFYWNKKKAQLAFIENYRFSSSIGKKVQKKYPLLTQDQIDLVIKGLRDYFYICNKAKRRMVAMPSQVVDVAWHEFILFTRPYQAFCKKALGRFLHHTPTEAMRTPTLAQDGIKRAWRLA
ncbi:glycine-rich domain-containing protein [Porticoccus sp.]